MEGIGTHVFRCYSFLIISILFSINLMWVEQVLSETYKVGGDEGWSESVDYFAWSENHNFSVGDILLFEYVKEEHNVMEVTEGTYKSCDGNSGLVRTYHSGSDQITLTETGNYWFICSFPGHCLDGMKCGVQVEEVNAVPQPSTSILPLEINGIYRFQASCRAWTCLLSFGILHFFNLI
ncbi:hypothetical protein NE237_024366 [Protea cynaroides]|uniref:Phytocyanin domain-containing protein n=1 Tax=Protea cynaroides TaxID=273540 RepID=A0A9Q0K681_9MAGN|nr:hypothetical protein NE237_024366 [Protea cynaroides]